MTFAPKTPEPSTGKRPAIVWFRAASGDPLFDRVCKLADEQGMSRVDLLRQMAQFALESMGNSGEN